MYGPKYMRRLMGSTARKVFADFYTERDTLSVAAGMSVVIGLE